MVAEQSKAQIMLLLFLLSPLCLGVGGSGPGFLIQLRVVLFS